jgi:hypothetical protein
MTLEWSISVGKYVTDICTSVIHRQVLSSIIVFQNFSLSMFYFQPQSGWILYLSKYDVTWRTKWWQATGSFYSWYFGNEICGRQRNPLVLCLHLWGFLARKHRLILWPTLQWDFVKSKPVLKLPTCSLFVHFVRKERDVCIVRFVENYFCFSI